MADQDLDALLMGALYGELEPADEARLAAHLESHPADRAALDDVRAVRTAFRDSGARFADVEPPPAVSAVLLQEAARRAPKQASWVRRAFAALAAHPALAAATTFVVVLGVAGSLVMTRSAPTLHSLVRAEPPAASVAAPVAAPVAARVAAGPAPPLAQSAPAKSPSGIALAPATPLQPKDMGDSAPAAHDDRMSQLPTRTQATAAAEPAAEDKPQSPVKKTPAPGKPVYDARWAQAQHAQVAALVQSGRCADAAPLALAIRAHAPAYYAAQVAKDRSLSACMPYIARKAEPSAKPEALSKNSADTKAAVAAKPTKAGVDTSSADAAPAAGGATPAAAYTADDADDDADDGDSAGPPKKASSGKRSRAASDAQDADSAKAPAKRK